MYNYQKYLIIAKKYITRRKENAQESYFYWKNVLLLRRLLFCYYYFLYSINPPVSGNYGAVLILMLTIKFKDGIF